MRAEERAVVQDKAEDAAQPELRHEVGVRPAYVTHSTGAGKKASDRLRVNY